MNVLEPIDASDFRQQAWANGGGTTTELAAGPDREHWHWRISIAEVAGEGAFSRLPGVRRQLAPLDVSLQLRFDDGSCLSARRFQVIHFDGDRPARCHLPDGPGRDINLMLREGVDGQLIVRPLVGSMVLPAGPAARWFVLMLAGEVRIRAGTERLTLEAGAAAWLKPEADSRLQLEGTGDIALVRLSLPAHQA